MGFIDFGAYAFYSFSIVKVNGHSYNEIISGKDLVADILPPPEYIIESDQGNIEQLIKKSEDLETEYYTRHEYWNKTLSEGEMKRYMTVDSYNYAVEFFDIRDKEFFPTIREGDREKAESILTGKMTAASKGIEVFVIKKLLYDNLLLVYRIATFIIF